MKTWNYPNRDTRAWPAGQWDDEPDKMQWTDESTGFVCLMARNPILGHWCGYVGLEPDHPWHGKDYDDVPASVHGGVNYGESCMVDVPEFLSVCHTPEPGKPDDIWWIGFDFAHAGDWSPGSPFKSRKLRYWDSASVMAECRKLAAQASNANKSQWVCPFCGNPLPGERAACCGEVGHAVLEPMEAE